MSRKNSEDSSLELLLDTMCNTFGGVMFIAISLAVMISFRSTEKSENIPDPSEKIAAVQAQLDQLRQEMGRSSEETKRQAEELERMKSDPRLRLVHEIALLERMVREKEAARKLAEKKTALSRSTLKELEIRTLKAEQLRKEKEKELKEIQVRQEKKEKELAELRKKIGSVKLRDMVFSTLVKKSQIPYFIFVNSGRVWAIGPEISGESYKPNDEVTYTVNAGHFLCSPVPGKGRDIFSGDALSSEFREFLKNIPSDRVPEFVISPGDAVVFHRLREVLKKERLFHGFRVQKKDGDIFDYQFSNESRSSYEY